MARYSKSSSEVRNRSISKIEYKLMSDEWKSFLGKENIHIYS